MCQIRINSPLNAAEWTFVHSVQPVEPSYLNAAKTVPSGIPVCLAPPPSPPGNSLQFRLQSIAVVWDIGHPSLTLLWLGKSKYSPQPRCCANIYHAPRVSVCVGWGKGKGAARTSPPYPCHSLSPCTLPPHGYCPPGPRGLWSPLITLYQADIDDQPSLEASMVPGAP